MPRRALVAAALAAAVTLLLAAPSSGGRAKYPPDELDISNMSAIFSGCPVTGAPFPPNPPECATHYSVRTLHAPEGATLHYEWFIQLKLIDNEGAPEPGTPGSGADFDPTCDNAELPGSKVVEGAAGASGVVYSWENQKNTFVWYHGDKGVYSDNPSYGCDHTKMGPDGHQGIVEVIVDDSGENVNYTPWICQANYYGTNTGFAEEEDTDCHPEASTPTQYFLVATAYNDEVIAGRMLKSTKNKGGAKAELEHALADLKVAAAKSGVFEFKDPYWTNNLNQAIADDEAALKEVPNGDYAEALLKARAAKARLLDYSEAWDDWMPWFAPLPNPH